MTEDQEDRLSVLNRQDTVEYAVLEKNLMNVLGITKIPEPFVQDCYRALDRLKETGKLQQSISELVKSEQKIDEVLRGDKTSEYAIVKKLMELGKDFKTAYKDLCSTRYAGVDDVETLNKGDDKAALAVNKNMYALQRNVDMRMQRLEKIVIGALLKNGQEINSIGGVVRGMKESVDGVADSVSQTKDELSHKIGTHSKWTYGLLGTAIAGVIGLSTVGYFLMENKDTIIKNIKITYSNLFNEKTQEMQQNIGATITESLNTAATDLNAKLQDLQGQLKQTQDPEEQRAIRSQMSQLLDYVKEQKRQSFLQKYGSK